MCASNSAAPGQEQGGSNEVHKPRDLEPGAWRKRLWQGTGYRNQEQGARRGEAEGERPGARAHHQQHRST
eukprot:4809485-Alexandrium_andersonii.AAC.1